MVDVTVSGTPYVNVSVSGTSVVSGGSAPLYTGKYEVTPLANKDTTLETKSKIMSKNVHVLEIPYFEVSNESGNTVYIGGESETI